jgi:pyrrolysine biosynthesis protein PylD
MTRLITEWLGTSREEMERYGASVAALTGLTPARLAAKAAARLAGGEGASALGEDFAGVSGVKAGVVRVTSGLGVIGGFTDSLVALLAWLGADVIAPVESDVDGIYHAVKAGADVIFIADDDRFICMNLTSGVIAENDESTAYGYAEALNLMSGGISGKEVLVIGYGRVGRCALRALKGLGATVSVFDKAEDACAAAASDADGLVMRDGIGEYGLIFDATNEGGWLRADELRPDVLISSPGLPLSLCTDAREQLAGRVFADVLQTGASVMLSRALMP